MGRVGSSLTGRRILVGVFVLGEPHHVLVPAGPIGCTSRPPFDELLDERNRHLGERGSDRGRSNGR